MSFPPIDPDTFEDIRVEADPDSRAAYEKRNGPAGFSADPPPLSGGPTGQGGSPTVEPVSSPFDSPPQRIGLYRTEDHRYYWNGEGPLPSVTTVLGIIHKEAVVQWIAKETAKAAWRLRQKPVEPLPTTEDEYVSFLTSQPREQRDTAAKLGSYVHLLADMAPRAPESDSEPFPVTDEARPYLAAFRAFLGRYSASSIISSEKAVFGFGYAGTYDLLMNIDGELWLIDIKTSKGYYPEFGLQLAAYSRARYIGLEGDPTQYPMPQVQRTGILHLRPDQYPDTGWRLVEYPVTDRDYVAFLGALELWQWKNERRVTKSILNKGVIKGHGNGISTDPLATE